MDLSEEELEATKKLQEKTADEMFEELNYKKYDNHPEADEPLQPNMWTTQDCRVIEFTSKGIIDGKECIERISFDVLSERVICEAFVNGRRIGVVPFSTDEIKAINKKCKELRVVLMCEYCDINRAGKEFKVNKTSMLKSISKNDNLISFLLHDNEGTGLMIGTFQGYYYININYCPMCRKKVRWLDEKENNGVF